jgi:two-component system alkaline phosphatase synthesis response regulator PhoP
VSTVLVSTRDRLALDAVIVGLDAIGSAWRQESSADLEAIFGDRASQPPDLVVLDLSGPMARRATVRAIIAEAKHDRTVPVLALVNRIALDQLDAEVGFDDFILLPLDPEEFGTRVGLLVGRSEQGGNGGGPGQVQLGDLRIDPTRYEVWVGPRQVTLTFKEYELLRLLASEPGRVFTREILLDRVWGYDYFGGTRTVDVHVRRLRSKLEDPTHTFVETVRNVGYRLKLEPASRER